MLRSLRGALPGGLGDSVDELGLLMALLFVLSVFLHFLFRILDSSSNQRMVPHSFHSSQSTLPNQSLAVANQSKTGKPLY